MGTIKIRVAKLGDAPGIARVHVHSWKAAYKGIVEQAYLDEGLDLQQRTQRWRKNLAEGGGRRTFVAVDGRRMAGFATIGPSRDGACPDHAELYAIYMEPHWFGKGVGTLLFNRAVEYARQQGFERMFVNVLSENHKARAFYERRGASPVAGKVKDVIINDKSYPETVYAWPDLKAL